MDCYALAERLDLKPPQYLRGKEFLFEHQVAQDVSLLTIVWNATIDLCAPDKLNDKENACLNLRISQEELEKMRPTLDYMYETAKDNRITQEEVRDYLLLFYLGCQTEFERRKMLKGSDLDRPYVGATSDIFCFNADPATALGTNAAFEYPNRINFFSCSSIIFLRSPDESYSRLRSGIIVDAKHRVMLDGAEEMLHYLQYREDPQGFVATTERFAGKSIQCQYMLNPIEVEAGKEYKAICRDYSVGRFSIRNFIETILADHAELSSKVPMTRF